MAFVPLTVTEICTELLLLLLQEDHDKVSRSVIIY